MSLFRPRRQERAGESLLKGYIAPRGSRSVPGNVNVNNETALTHSAVWACRRLRADLISTFPIDVFKMLEVSPGVKVRVEMPKPLVLTKPGGDHWDYEDWVWASQSDLDTTGNMIGIIREWNSQGLPQMIELQDISKCVVVLARNAPMSARRYRIDGVEYPASKIWHERQFPVAGLPVGLSPIAAAAWSIGEYLNIQQFALDWFGGGAVPKARLKNKSKTIKNEEAAQMKERFKATMRNGDLFVFGQDWEYDMISAQNMGMEWLDAKRYGLADICRFFGCPADLIDAAISGGGTITYANITERNLQFLIHHLGPAVFRRERKFSSGLLPEPRYAKMNTNALLRMDPKAMAETIQMRIDARTLTVTEARALYDQPPLTAAQEAEFDRLFPPKAQKDSGAPAISGRSMESYARDLIFDEIDRRKEIEINHELEEMSKLKELAA